MENWKEQKHSAIQTLVESSTSTNQDRLDWDRTSCLEMAVWCE